MWMGLCGAESRGERKWRGSLPRFLPGPVWMGVPFPVGGNTGRGAGCLSPGPPGNRTLRERFLVGLFIGEHTPGEWEGGLEEMKQEARPQCQEALLSWPSL